MIAKTVLGLGCAACAIVASVVPSNVNADEEVKPRVSVEWVGGSSSLVAGSSKIQFKLFDTDSMRYLGDSDLSVVHEKLLHSYVYDAALVEFRHVHPDFDNEVWSFETDLPFDGRYRFWAQGTLASDGEEFAASIGFEVVDGEEAHELVELAEIRYGSDGVSRVETPPKTFYAKKMSMVKLDFSRTDGSDPEITPYLGANAHVTIVSENGESLVHAHPMASNDASSAMIHVVFPEPANYRMWVQFVDDDVLRTIPLAVKVLEKPGQ